MSSKRKRQRKAGDDHEGSSSDEFQEKKKKRFVVVDKEELTASKKAIEVKNTEKSTKWATNTFFCWLADHNERCEADDQCPAEVLFMKEELVCHWLCVFVKEARKEDSTPYSQEYFYAYIRIAAFYQFKEAAKGRASEAG